MEALWGQILRLAAVVEVSLNTAVRALCDARPDLAEEVNGQEPEIDRWEVRIEQECLKVLALHQPVACDLRRVAAVMRINGDLERMADLAAHIANRSRKLAREPEPVPVGESMEDLALAALSQVREALDALARNDAELARAVIRSDRRIDHHRRALLKQFKAGIRREPERVDTWLRLINTARNLERVADHATNIAEAVVYLKEGDIIRHEGSRLAGSA